MPTPFVSTPNFASSPFHSTFFPCTLPHTHGAKHDPLFPAGAVRIGAVRRRATATEASLGGDVGLWWLATELWAAVHGGPCWTTWPTALPNAKEATAETCAVQTTERRSSLANGPRGAQGAHRVSKSPSPVPRTQFQNDEHAPISPIDPRVAHQHHRRTIHGQFSRPHTDQLQYITQCAIMLNQSLLIWEGTTLSWRLEFALT